jgi:foldase protein PrsA
MLNKKFIPLIIFIIFIFISLGIYIYIYTIDPSNMTVIKVNNKEIKVDYFIRRILISGKSTLSMLQQITKEELITNAVSRAPYNLKIDEYTINQYIKKKAKGSKSVIDEDEFNEWFRQQKNELRLTDNEYKNLIKTKISIDYLKEYLSKEIPTTSEHIYLRMFPISDYGLASEINSKHKKGIKFEKLLNEYSIDKKVKNINGDFGWIPRGVFNNIFDEIAFNLELGQLSPPVYIQKNTVVMFIITKKTKLKKVDERSFEVLKNKVIDNWLVKNKKYYEVEYKGFNNGYDSETDAWIKSRINKLKNN